MIGHIEVMRESVDRLSRERWVFTYLDHCHALRLSMYYPETRATTRHKYRTERGCYVWYDKRSEVKNPPLPPDVAGQAMDDWRNSLRVLEVRSHY